MKKFIVLVACLFMAYAGVAQTQTERPNYSTAIAKFKRYYNNNHPDSLFSIFSPEVKAGLPLDKLTDMFTQMQAQIGQLRATTFTSYLQTAGLYKAEYANATLVISLSLNVSNQIDGLFFKEYKGDKPADAKVTTVAPATQTPANDPEMVESPIDLKTLSGNLSGTLTMPKNVSSKIPVVLIIAGSGPTDRDGNSTIGDVHPNTYKMIAASLAKSGIASLRYDKRGVGQSKTSAKEASLVFTNFSDDANQLADMLHDDGRFSKIIILGHSEGSLLGMLFVATTEIPVNGFISVAGAADPADVIITEQMKKSAPPAVQTELKRIIDSLRKGKKTDRVDPALYSIMRPSIQKYMMNWMAFDPVRVIKRVKVPTLLIQGTTDMQIGVDQAYKLKKAKSEAQLKIIDGMSHILKDGPPDREQNLATYSDPALPLKPEFMTAVISFINNLK